MDPQGHIYEGDPDKIPAEDKARLDGYLKARSEADERKRIEADLERLRRQFDEANPEAAS